ncbi:uncharacterized protein SPAPADRAFT_51266 [Spathaspora passalidarum NRRL Y-27907]|uniref:Uncharacterized protein n=1 Tax=Spathaspora passalidarum (strain NRRL Y-27907 / 11-Y1) TaxID=619300 RepID=G3AR61_SPAPN|nr:uncharacterized protein SPAPADRAFT_51266 [Spathaspora passalidarum NRRL Y-27907]EGW31237.1 hypothetical protein SPAPADRAFT_51266 [Spathaspora passalidarum NRRL Y-27907]
MVGFARYLSKVPGDTPEIKKPTVITKRKTSKLDEGCKIKSSSVDKHKKTKKVESLAADAAAAATATAIAATTSASVTPNTAAPPPTSVQPTHYKQLPKLPETISNLAISDLYKSVGLDPPTTSVSTPSPTTFVDFKIPDKYIKSLRDKPKDEKDFDDKERNIVTILESIARGETKDESGNLPMLSIDIDNDVFILDPRQRPHPLKSSISGMLELNPGLNDIDDEYLWDNLPMDGLPPYQKTPLGFKEWELEQIEKKKMEKLKSEEYDRKYAKLKAALANPKAFYKKVGGRTKVDRKLLKQYLKLKEEGKIPEEWRNNNTF